MFGRSATKRSRNMQYKVLCAVVGSRIRMYYEEMTVSGDYGRLCRADEHGVFEVPFWCENMKI